MILRKTPFVIFYRASVSNTYEWTGFISECIYIPACVFVCVCVFVCGGMLCKTWGQLLCCGLNSYIYVTLVLSTSACGGEGSFASRWSMVIHSECSDICWTVVWILSGEVIQWHAEVTVFRKWHALLGIPPDKLSGSGYTLRFCPSLWKQRLLWWY